MTRTKSQRRKPRSVEDRLLIDAGKFLKTIGWTALVASVQGIQAVPGEKHQYELLIRFTGGQDPEKTLQLLNKVTDRIARDKPVQPKKQVRAGKRAKSAFPLSPAQILALDTTPVELTPEDRRALGFMPQ